MKPTTIRSTCFAIAAFSVSMSAFAVVLVGSPFNDTLIGTNGNDIIDGRGGDDNLVGKRGDDAMTGELYDDVGAGHPDIIVECRAGAGADYDPNSPVVSGQSFASFNDILLGDRGNDVATGEVYAVQFGALQLNSLSGTGGYFGGAGGNFNSTDCFHDQLDGGRDIDTLTGDVNYLLGPDDVNLTAAAGASGPGRWSYAPHGPGASGGNDNSTFAYNDSIKGGRDKPGADDLIIGDVFGSGTDGSEDNLSALAGTGGFESGAGGSGNHVNAFNDRMTGNRGHDEMFGDSLRRGGTGGVTLLASAGSSGDAPFGFGTGGNGGDDNLVEAFSDLMDGGRGPDLLIGDADMANAPGEEIRLAVLSGANGTLPSTSLGGTNNQVVAFNDSLVGGRDNDLLIGEACITGDGDSIEVLAAGTAGNSITAFQDTIAGERGDDRIYGDFCESADCESARLDLVGAFTGQASLFADTISGGRGKDLIVGGPGADTMAGNQGADTFAYIEGDLFDLVNWVPVGTPPVDTITDFSNSDKLDLRKLLTCLGYEYQDDVIDDWLALTGTGSSCRLHIDQIGGGAYQPMLDLPGFPCAGLTIADLISSGNLIVPP